MQNNSHSWFNIKSGIIIADVLLLLAMISWLPFDPQVNKGLSILVFIAVLWFSEALHITITALLVPVLAVLLGVFTVSKSLADFSNPVLFLFFGGFALAAALSKQGLDIQIAAKMMQMARGNMAWGAIILFAITAVLSMWISNTATTAMMLPLALGMVKKLDAVKERRTLVFVLLGVAYSASIGGIGTLVGSPPNAIAAAQMHLTFTDWLKFGIPIVILMLPCCIGLLYLVIRPNLRHNIEVERVSISWTVPRKTTLIIFLLTVIFWIFSGPISGWLNGIKQFDTLVALCAIAAIAVTRVASWDDISKNTDWGVLLLFGGGLTLSSVLKVTKTSQFLADHLSAMLTHTPVFIILLVLATFVIFLTELASNTATAALLVPLFAGVASSLGVSDVILSVLIAIGASCAFMLPVATPPNALVFASGAVRQQEMMRAGFSLNIAFVVVITLLAYFVGDAML